MEWSAGSVPNERIQQMDLKTWLEPTFPCIHTTLVAALCVYKVILHLPRVRRSLQKTTRRCENMLVICITIVLFSFDTTAAREQIQRSPRRAIWSFTVIIATRSLFKPTTPWLHLPTASLIQQLSKFNTDYLLVFLPKKKTPLYFPCSLFTRADSWHARLHVEQALISARRSPKESNRWGKSWSNLFFFFFFLISI